MARKLSVIDRRRFMQSTAALAGLLHAPAVLRAQSAAVKVGVLHPVSGALSYSGQQGRLGAQLAIEEINGAERGGLQKTAAAHGRELARHAFLPGWQPRP